MNKNSYYALIYLLCFLSLTTLLCLPVLGYCMKHRVDDARTLVDTNNTTPEQKSAAHKEIDLLEHNLNNSAVSLLAFSAISFSVTGLLFIKRKKIIIA